MLCATFLQSVPPQIRKKFIVAAEFQGNAWVTEDEERYTSVTFAFRRVCSILLVLYCSDRIKCIQQFLRKLRMNFKNLKKFDILKRCVKIYFNQNFKCLVVFEGSRLSITSGT